MLNKWGVMTGFMVVTHVCFADLLMTPLFRLPQIWLGGSGLKQTAANSMQNTVSVGQPLAGQQLSNGSLQVRGGFIQSLGTSSSIGVPINPGIDNELCLDFPLGRVCVTIPAGAFDEALTMNLSYPSDFPDPFSDVLKLNETTAGSSLLNDKSLIPKKPLIYTFTYNQDTLNGQNEKFFTLACYIEAQDRWIPIKSNLNTNTNTITGETTCGPLVSIMAVVPTDSLDQVKVYPNPVRPNQGDRFLYLANLPDGTGVQVFTVSGAWVETLEGLQNGLLTWDLTNREGHLVASDLYLLLIRHGASRKTLIIGVER